MTFDKNNALAKTWVKMLKKTNSPYTIDDVPNIGNLREVVKELMKEEANS